jgi:hypothetical protein
MTGVPHPQVCDWHEWRALTAPGSFTSRTYVGNETCETLLPEPDRALDLLEPVLAAKSALTLVTPFLTEAGLRKAIALVSLLAPKIPRFEVVCNDWGLCAQLAAHALCTPVVGRLLVGQHRDPRWQQAFNAAWQRSQERDVVHRDGTVARLTYRPVNHALALHLRRPALDQSDLLGHLAAMGITRYEVNNLPHGLEIRRHDGISVTLHVPSVLVSAARDCRVPTGDRVPVPVCGSGSCPPPTAVWRHASFPGPLYHYCNGIYALSPALPDDPAHLGVDRIVRCHRFDSGA